MSTDAARFVTALRRTRSHVYDLERDLHEDIKKILVREGIPFRHEVKLGGRLGQIDFMIGRVGVEVKIGVIQFPRVRAQLIRYLESDDIDSLILVTEKALPDPPENVEQVALHQLWGIVV